MRKRLEEDGDNEHLQRQSTLVHHAQITTIDSFCSYVVKNYFHLIDLDPSFRMGDEGEMRLLQADVADKVMEEAYSAENNEKFCAFADNFSSGKTDDKYRGAVIRKLYGFSISIPIPTGVAAELQRGILHKNRGGAGKGLLAFCCEGGNPQADSGGGSAFSGSDFSWRRTGKRPAFTWGFSGGEDSSRENRKSRNPGRV